MKKEIQLICFLGLCFKAIFVNGLNFDRNEPIKVDNPNGNFEVGKPAKLTCFYALGRTERVHTVKWYLSYQNKDYGKVSTGGPRNS